MLTDSIIEAVFNTAEVPDDDDQMPTIERLSEHSFRPDVVMQILYDVLGEHLLQALHVLDSNQPNANHILLAQLAAHGYLRCVVSTNYDRPIEIACEQLQVPVHVVVTPEEFANIPANYDGLLLCKLHGTVERPQTLVARINDISRGLDAEKSRAIDRLFAQYHFLFLGYSGNDFAINSDYLLLEKAEPRSKGFTWLLRPGEVSLVVQELLNQYGDKSRLLNANLPDILFDLFERVGVVPPSVPNAVVVSAASVDEQIEAWATTITQENACYGLGRLFLYGGMWGEAINAIKIFYRITRDAQDNLYTIGVASYYLAHAWERFKKYHQFEPNLVADVMMLLNQSRVSFARIRDRLMSARTLHTMARYYGLDNLAETQRLFGEAIELYQAHGALAELAEAYIDIGDMLSQTTAESAEIAKQFLVRGLEIAQLVGDLRQMARAHTALGYILMFDQELEESERHYVQALRWVRIIGDRALLPLILRRYGNTLMLSSQWERAHDYLKESLEIFEHSGTVHPTVTTRNALALAYEKLGENQLAKEQYVTAKTFAQLFNLAAPVRTASLGLARITLLEEDFAQAKSLAQEVLVSCDHFTHPDFSLAIELLGQITAKIIAQREEPHG